MKTQITSEHRIVWKNKPVLREIYRDYFRRIAGQCISGKTLEIGSGSGNLKEYMHEVVSTDIVPNSWLDVAADAQSLPFANESFANVVGIDVLHHIERPRRFLAEADRVLQPGGRLILIEPAITPGSWFFYHYVHPEPVVMDTDPLEDGLLDPDRQAFDANQAIPTLLFSRYRDQIEALFPLLKIKMSKHLSLFAYPLSGGFQPWSFIPTFAVNPVLRFENVVAPWLGRWIGFRLFIVVEKEK
jgi:SAM-dependent methyltransferase